MPAKTSMPPATFSRSSSESWSAFAGFLGMTKWTVVSSSAWARILASAGSFWPEYFSIVAFGSATNSSWKAGSFHARSTISFSISCQLKDIVPSRARSRALLA